jgi:hypothetical protein
MEQQQADGLLEMNSLREAGFDDKEVEDWRANTTQELEDAGFSGKEVQEYFGEKEPDMTRVKDTFTANLQAKQAAAKPAEPEGSVTVPNTSGANMPKMKQADSFLEAIEAGFDMSVSGLAMQRPDMMLPENAPMFYRIASQVSTLAGDIPAMVAGGVGGGAAGAAAGTVTLPVVGTVGLGVVGAGVGAMALPEAMRTAMMEHYEKGDVKSFSDFWERTSAVAINSLKAGVVGGVTMGAGGVVAKGVAKVAAPTLVKTSAQLMAEAATMTTVGAALEGKVPEPHEFLDAAILVGGLRGSTYAAGKIRGMYSKNGATPLQVAEQVQNDPHLKQQILAENVPHPTNAELGPRLPNEKPPENFPLSKPFNEKVYHGTFKEFKPEDIQPSAKGKYGEGFYLTKDEMSAKNYGDKILEFNINASKVLDVTDIGSSSLTAFAKTHGLELNANKMGDAYGQLLTEIRKKFPNEDLVGTSANKKLNELLKQEGYEGIQFAQNDSTANLVLFDRANIKTSGEMSVNGIPEKVTNINLSPEVNKILSKVGTKGESPGLIEKVKAEMQTSKLYTNFVDKLDPINQATKVLTENPKELLADNNPYMLARISVDSNSKARHFFEKGTIDFATKEVNGPSLRSTLEKVESVETLEAYMISKRAIEKHGQGMQTGFDIVAAEKVVAQNKTKYEAAARQVTDFANKSLDYVRDAGIISPEQHSRMLEANKDYVPFKRIGEDKAGNPKAGGKAGSLKEFKGSEKEIQSPILSIVENTTELIKMAEQNRPKTALIKLAEKNPGQELIKPVPERMQPVKISKEELAVELKKQGVIEGTAQAEAIQDMMVFRKQQTDLTPNQFSVFENGKRKVYETTPELAEAIGRLGGDTTSTNLAFKIMNGITTIKKIGITFTPEFIVKNFMRDTLTASTFSKSKGMSPVDIVSAMGDIWKKNDTYYAWLKSGGANGAFLDMGQSYITKDIYKLQRETNFFNSVRNLVEKPVDIMRVAAELSEQSLRVAEFKKVRKMGGSLTEGGFASREITIDFQRVGAKVSALNSITAFMNVSIQGLDRTTRAFKENPTALATKSLTYITVPSLLLYWANKDDPRYKEIPRWQKDMFWIIPTDKWTDTTPEEADGLPEYMVRESGGKIQINKGTIYKIPKPQELGIVFGSLPERVLEKYFSEDQNAMKDFDKTMVELVTPAMIPDAVTPAVEQYFNKSFFTGRDIVPHHLKDVLPEYQFVEYTSEVAKTLGKMVATVDKQSDFASPMVIQNYIQSWGGSLGKYAVQVADKALVATGVAPDIVKPADTLADVPFIKAFVVRFPNAGSNSVQDFYSSYDESHKLMTTIKHLAKEGDFDSMEKELTLNANQDKLMQLDGIKEALTAQSKFIRLTYKNPDMSADEKRQMIDGVYLMMTETAKMGNALVKEVKQSLGEK